jgi:integrase
MRIIGRLTARKVATAKPRKGRDWDMIPDGGNLYLQIRIGSGGRICKSWLFLYQLLGRRREMGVGVCPDVSLAQARAKARVLREQLRNDIDPLEQKQERRRALLAERTKAITFAEAAAMYHRLHLPGWKNPRHAAQWLKSLEDHVFPAIGRISVSDIDAPLILKTIEPVWLRTPVTGQRCLNRVEVTLDYSIANGLRPGPNPATGLARALPKRTAIAPVEHFPAMDFTDLPEFMRDLRAVDTLAARALEFTILTGARVGMTINAVGDGISGAVWTVPGEKMKKGREHRVPLSARALAILRHLPRTDERIFPGIDGKRLARLLKRLRPGADVSVHGFRATFKTWCSERTSYSHDTVEEALAHAIPSAVEKAYRRGDLFKRRIALMETWARFCAGPPAAAGATVTPMRKVAADA